MLLEGAARGLQWLAAFWPYQGGLVSTPVPIRARSTYAVLGLQGLVAEKKGPIARILLSRLKWLALGLLSIALVGIPDNLPGRLALGYFQAEVEWPFYLQSGFAPGAGGLAWSCIFPRCCSIPRGEPICRPRTGSLEKVGL